ncbi:MAG: hypothetical protein EG822_16750 [Deltaproteobacteria bacterium]|nr:hypothetical protein [Deltaproteobacteria bacterium]TLN01422.1 MAG: hypothetical protein FDZ73_15955 [bacterium]
MKHYLLTGERNSGLDGDSELKWLFFCDKGKLSELWGTHRDALLTEWIKNNPCSRPWYWWVEEAPKEIIPGFENPEDHSLYPEYYERSAYQARRERLGGTGTPAYEVLAYGPAFDMGIPHPWVTKFDEDYYNGRAVDIHGNIIQTNYKEGHFKGKAIDPNDPPTFESEAAYLSRHGLLTKEEKAYLKKHPELLEPEAVIFDECDEEESETEACTPL